VGDCGRDQTAIGEVRLLCVHPAAEWAIRIT
jgi:hypothetical protein